MMHRDTLRWNQKGTLQHKEELRWYAPELFRHRGAAVEWPQRLFLRSMETVYTPHDASTRAKS